MLPEFGHFALILAFCFSLLLIIVPLIGLKRDDLTLLRLAPVLAFAQCFFVTIAFVCLVISFINDDFTVLYVASNSSLKLPWFYKACAVWGAHEGSMLLWVQILSGWTVAVGVFRGELDDAFLARVLSILGFIAAGFFLFLLSTSDPFIRLFSSVPLNGRDLNPLLQDLGFLFHPPMLYMGYVGFSVAFAFAIASLTAGRLDPVWARWSRPWTLAAWCALTLGITLGSWWAYRELGWGGFWFWDPVENASFMPWLVGSALLHSLAVTEKRNTFKAWTVLLAITVFSLSLLGTFLVRSGVLTSVHAFAVDPTRGLYMLVFLFVVVGLSLTLFALRSHTIKIGESFSLLSRETFLMMNNVFLAVMMLSVLLGTLYPLIVDALGVGKLSVGAPYFNQIFIPLLMPLLFLMGLAPHCQWKVMSKTSLLERVKHVFFLSLVCGLFVPWALTGEVFFSTSVAVILSLWLIFSTLKDGWLKITARKRNLPQAQWGMVVAHIGVAVSVLGVALSMSYGQEQFLRMQPGDKVALSDYQIQFIDLTQLKGPNYHGVKGRFSISHKGSPPLVIYPEKRIYDVQKMAMTDAAIDASITRDIYVALGEPVGDSAWAVRVYYKPFMRWIWGGGVMIFIGGLLAMTDRRYYRRKKKPNKITATQASELHYE